MRQVMKTIVSMMVLGFTHAMSSGGTALYEASSQTPPLDTARAKLEFLVGSFTTETAIPPMPGMPKGATGKGTTVITWSLDSMFLSIDEQSMNEFFGQYKGHGMLGFEAQTNQFVLSMFNNFGDHPEYHGTFVADTLVLQTKIAAQRRSFDQKILWYKEGDAVKMKVLNDSGKGYYLALEQKAVPITHRR